MSELLHPKEITLTSQMGTTKTFILSKVPAIPARELVAKYPTSNMPKMGDYAVSEEAMLKLMTYVAVVSDNGTQIRLTTKELINNHVEDWEVLGKLEVGMMEYNVSFFGHAVSLISFDTIEKMVNKWISKISTGSSARSSRKKAQPSTN